MPLSNQPPSAARSAVPPGTRVAGAMNSPSAKISSWARSLNRLAAVRAWMAPAGEHPGGGRAAAGQHHADPEEGVGAELVAAVAARHQDPVEPGGRELLVNRTGILRARLGLRLPADQFRHQLLGPGQQLMSARHRIGGSRKTGAQRLGGKRHRNTFLRTSLAASVHTVRRLEAAMDSCENAAPQTAELSGRIFVASQRRRHL